MRLGQPAEFSADFTITGPGTGNPEHDDIPSVIDVEPTYF